MVNDASRELIMKIRINEKVVDVPEGAIVRVDADKIYVNDVLVEGEPVERKEIRCGQYEQSPNCDKSR